MTRIEPYYSEEDLRTKVIYTWLKHCAISENDIAIERTFNIQLGRKSKTVHPRTDLLVKFNGKNLFIVEVKAPSHNLADADKDQALSYARILCDGIAPFTILTNGEQTLIFDSVTGESLIGDSVPDNHPYVKAGFKVTGDGIKARMEALEFLISLSVDNLLMFCEGQVENRMRILKGSDIFSGRKYVPSLYVKRKTASSQLRTKLFGDNRKPATNFLLVVGAPQQGKTCFMCHTIEELLQEGYPCLFYPAVALRDGLLNAIKEDFEWCFGEHMEIPLWIKRLELVASKAGKKMFLFVDGWNEMTENAIAINEECRRLNSGYISVILSTTSPSLLRLLKDSSDNIAYAGERTSLEDSIIRKLMVEPLKNTSDLGIVQVGKFEYDEINIATKVYSRAYNVTITDNHPLLRDPFYLHLASEQYASGTVPLGITKSGLIRNGLVRKAARRSIREVELFLRLGQIAKVFFENDRPVDARYLAEYFSTDADLSPWTESAILILFTNLNVPKVDFYFTHDFDYSISVLSREWHKLFGQCEASSIKAELNCVAKTEANCDALKWFLSCPEHYDHLQNVFHSVIFSNLPISIKTSLAGAVFNQVKFNGFKDTAWLEPFLVNLTELDVDELVDGDNFPELTVAYMQSISLDSEKEKFNAWLKFLVSIDFTIENDVEDSYTFGLLNEKWNGLDKWAMDGNDRNFDTTVFYDRICNGPIPVAIRSAIFCVTLIRDSFLRCLPKLIQQSSQSKEHFQKILKIPCEIILRDLSESYYGSMCPGWFDSLDEVGYQEVKEEYAKWRHQCKPIISVFGLNSNISERMIDILKDLRHYAGEDEELDFSVDNKNENRLDL